MSSLSAYPPDATDPESATQSTSGQLRTIASANSSAIVRAKPFRARWLSTRLRDSSRRRSFPWRNAKPSSRTTSSVASTDCSKSDTGTEPPMRSRESASIVGAYPHSCMTFSVRTARDPASSGAEAKCESRSLFQPPRARIGYYLNSINLLPNPAGLRRAGPKGARADAPAPSTADIG